MKVLVIAFGALLLSACQTVPKDPNQLPLQATQGVKDLFANNATPEEAQQQIRCERRTDTGTRISKRVCWTVGESVSNQGPRALFRMDQVDPALRVSN